METKNKLSKRQKVFVKLAEDNDLKIDYDYSGRGMFGKTCPAVRLRNLSQWPGNPHKYEMDNMGLGYVIYCQS